MWTEPGLGNNSKSSYLLCQMNWHTVRVTKQGPNITITLDELHTVSGPVTHGMNIRGELFLGGHPGNFTNICKQQPPFEARCTRRFPSVHYPRIFSRFFLEEE